MQFRGLQDEFSAHITSGESQSPTNFRVDSLAQSYKSNLEIRLSAKL